MTCLQTGNRARSGRMADAGIDRSKRNARVPARLLRAIRSGHLVASSVRAMDPRAWPRAASGHLQLRLGGPRLGRPSLGVSGSPGNRVRVGGRCRDDSAGIHRGLRSLLDRNDGPRPRMAALAGRPVLAPRTCPHGHATRSPAGGFLARLSRLLPRRTRTSGTTSEIGLAPAACPALLGQYSRSFRARTHRALLLPVRMRCAFMGRLTNGR